MRLPVAVALATLLAAAPMPAVAAAGPSRPAKVDLCHYVAGTSSFGLISVDARKTAEHLASGDVILTPDMAGSCDHLVTGRVWKDVNGNGRQDRREPGIAGTTVHLDDGGTDLTQVTDASGRFAFRDVAPNDYLLSVPPGPGGVPSLEALWGGRGGVVPPGWSPTADPDGTATPYYASITVPSAGLGRVDWGFHPGNTVSVSTSTTPYRGDQLLTVTTGATPGTFGALAGWFSAPYASPLTGTLAVPDPILACAALTDDMTGKVVVIERGVCGFVTKVMKAQAAGAVAVVVYNTAPWGDAVIRMGGTDPTITIPAVFVGSTTGLALAAQAGETVTLAPDPLRFHFSGSLGAFDLGAGASRVFTGLANGPDAIAQGATAGWSLDHAACFVSGVVGTVAPSSLHLAGGQYADCTFVDVESL